MNQQQFDALVKTALHELNDLFDGRVEYVLITRAPTGEPKTKNGLTPMHFSIEATGCVHFAAEMVDNAKESITKDLENEDGE